jgi:hypothetical protein
VLKRRDIRDRSRLYNIDKKGVRLGCPVEEEVIVLTYIKKIYTSIPKNYKSLIIIELVSVDRRAIPSVTARRKGVSQGDAMPKIAVLTRILS